MVWGYFLETLWVPIVHWLNIRDPVNIDITQFMLYSGPIFCLHQDNAPVTKLRQSQTSFLKMKMSFLHSKGLQSPVLSPPLLVVGDFLGCMTDALKKIRLMCHAKRWEGMFSTRRVWPVTAGQEFRVDQWFQWDIWQLAQAKSVVTRGHCAMLPRLLSWAVMYKFCPPPLLFVFYKWPIFITVNKWSINTYFTENLWLEKLWKGYHQMLME